MKKNLLLLGILLALVALAYYFEEHAHRVKRGLTSKLFNFEQVKEIHLKRTALLKRGHSFFVKEPYYPANPHVVGHFLDHLRGLRIVRVITKQEKEKIKREAIFSKDPELITLKFKGGEVVYRLGTRLPYDESFYIKVLDNKTEMLVLVKDNRPSEGVYFNEKEFRNDKYQKLTKLLSHDKDYFLEKRVFPQRSKIRWIQLINQRNRPFKIFFKKRITRPHIYDGLTYNKNYFKNYQKKILNLSAQEIFISSDLKKLKNKVATLKIKGITEANLSLYKEYQGIRGYFLLSSENTSLYRLSRLDAQIFFQNVQDFWSKKALPAISFKDMAKMNLSMIFASKQKFDLLISYSEKLKITVLKPAGFTYHPNINNFINFLNIFFSIGQKQANYASVLKNFETKGLEVYYKNESFRLYFEGNELIIINLKSKLKLHYIMGGKKLFGLKVNDFFKKE